MAVIFIDPLNPFAGNGTQANPFRQFPTVTAGNTYLIRAGRVVNQKISVGVSGTGDALNQRVVIGSYGDGPPPLIVGTDMCIQISTDRQFITIDGLELTGATLRGIGNATTGSSNTVVTAITVQNCKIRNLVPSASVDVNGIQLWGAQNKVYNNEIFRIPTDGIWMLGDGMEVEGNKIYEISLDGREAGDCLQIGGNATNPTIRWNYLDHLGRTGKQGIMLQDSAATSGGTIEYNWVRHENDANATAAIYLGQPGITCRRNFVIGGNVGINSPWGSTVIEGNIVINDFNRGIDIGPNGVTCQNNTVISPRRTGVIGIRNTTIVTDATIQNNIIYGFETGLSIAASGITERHNCIFGATTASNRALGANTGIFDPELDEDFYPRNLGAKIGGIASTLVDFYGRNFAAVPSIGAVQAAEDKRRLMFYRTLVP